MTAKTLKNGTPLSELSSIVRATDEEKQLLLRRAFLIRHGETEWSLSGQHTGTTDIPLTENGRNVARQLEPLLKKATFSLVLTSPLHRARQTCELTGLGAQAEVDANLIEWNYGEYEGLTPKQIHAKAPDWMLFSDGCPGGESPSQVGARVDQVIARIRSVEGDVALFAHGHVFRVFAARWLGLPLSYSYGRALQDEALKAWRGRQENIAAAQQAFNHRAKCDSAAALGKYTTSMETESVVA